MDANLTQNTCMILVIELILIIFLLIVVGCVFIYKGGIFIINTMCSTIMGLKKCEEPWSTDELKINKEVNKNFE